MNQPLVTFIVPAYNAAPWIQTCLDSIYRLPDSEGIVEVIVINDGSTDETPAILTRYAQQHGELRIITQENRGLSAARNAGLREARGIYVAFVDADDQLSPVAKLPLYHLIRCCFDIIGIDVERVWEGQLHPYRRYIPRYDYSYESGKEFVSGRNLFPCVWSYFFRREFLLDNDLFFHEGILHEDEDFTPRAFVKAGPIIFAKGSYYWYMFRSNSITTTHDEAAQRRRFRDLLTIIEGLKSLDEPALDCKIDYLVIDLLRVLLRQSHDREFIQEILSGLQSLGFYPLRRRWDVRYLAHCSLINTRLRRLKL